MLKEIKTLFRESKSIFSILSLSLLFGIAQLISYFYEVAYYNYFNIDSSFISVNILQDIANIVIIISMIGIIIAEIYLVYYTGTFIYKYRNRDSLEKNILWIMVTPAFFGILYIFLNTYINREINGRIIVDKSAIFFVFVGMILVVFKIFKNYIDRKQQQGREEGVNKEDKILNRIFLFLGFAIMVIVTLNQISEFGKANAEAKKDFLLNTVEDKIILYNTSDFSIMADYEYNEQENSVIIYADELEKISNDSIKFISKTFSKVEVKY